jgi:hypothetical protein
LASAKSTAAAAAPCQGSRAHSGNTKTIFRTAAASAWCLAWRLAVAGRCVAGCWRRAATYYTMTLVRRKKSEIKS